MGPVVSKSWFMTWSTCRLFRAQCKCRHVKSGSGCSIKLLFRSSLYGTSHSFAVLCDFILCASEDRKIFIVQGCRWGLSLFSDGVRSHKAAEPCCTVGWVGCSTAPWLPLPGRTGRQRREGAKSLLATTVGLSLGLALFIYWICKNFHIARVNRDLSCVLPATMINTVALLCPVKLLRQPSLNLF